MPTYELRDIQQSAKGDDKNKPQVVIMDNRSAGPNSAIPIDRYSIVYIVLLIHGIGALMPWNMFITADGYFRDYKLTAQNATEFADNEKLTELRANFMSVLGFAAQLPNLLFNGLNLLVNLGSGNLGYRINVSLLLEAAVFAFTIVLAIVDSSQWPIEFFYITMISVVVLNIASGVYQNCVFGTGAKFPGTYTNAILIGSNCSGTFTSIINIVTIYLAPKPEVAAIYYFATALFMIVFCLITYNLLSKNRFFRYHDAASEAPTNALEITQIAPKQVEDGIEPLEKTVDAMTPKNNATDDGQTMTFKQDMLFKWNVFKQCWPQLLNTFLIFFVTLCIFPSASVDVVPLQNYISRKYFTPIAVFLIVNGGALLGNLISGLTTWPGRDRVWILVVSRILLIPFFLYCNYLPDFRQRRVLFKNDFYFIIGNLILGASSGYLSSLCMMFASSGLKPDEAPKAGMMASFFLILGLFCGALSSFISRWYVT